MNDDKAGGSGGVKIGDGANESDRGWEEVRASSIDIDGGGIKVEDGFKSE